MENIQKVTEEIKVKDWGMLMHMSFSKYHILENKGILICNGKPLDGKELHQIVKTPKTKNGNFGKATQKFFIVEKDAPEFDTIDKLIEHYHPTVIEPTAPIS